MSPEHRAILERMRSTAGVVRQAVEAAPPGRFGQPPREGEWSAGAGDAHPPARCRCPRLRAPDPAEVAQAEEHYRRALALAYELGMRPLVAHCHLGLGKLYRRTGQRQEAQEHLTSATMMYREMDMQHWLEKAEAEVSTPG